MVVYEGFRQPKVCLGLVTARVSGTASALFTGLNPLTPDFPSLKLRKDPKLYFVAKVFEDFWHHWKVDRKSSNLDNDTLGFISQTQQ